MYHSIQRLFNPSSRETWANPRAEVGESHKNRKDMRMREELCAEGAGSGQCQAYLGVKFPREG